MFEGSNLGEVIADRQALMAALAISTNGAENDRIKGGLDNADGTIDEMRELFKDDEWSTAMDRQQEQLNINYGLYKQVNEQLSGFNQSLGGLMEKHEGLATAAYAAGTALAAIGAAGAVGGLLGGAGGAAGAAAGAAKFAGKAGLVGAAGVAGYGVGAVINDKFIEGTAAQDVIGEKIAQALALFGNDSAQAALDANAKYDQMIAEQQETKAKQEQMVNEQAQTKQIQSQLVSQQGVMISHLSNIAAKPVPTFNPVITIGGRSTAMNMMDEIGKQTKRGKYGPYR